MGPKNFYNAVDQRKLGTDQIEDIKNKVDSIISLPKATSSDEGKVAVVNSSGEWELGTITPSSNPVTILEDGVVCENAAYQVATFDDISDFGIIAVSLNDGGTEHPDCVCTTIQSIIDNGGTINLPAGFNDMRVQLTLTSITLTWFSGGWRKVTADIKGWK